MASLDSEFANVDVVALDLVPDVVDLVNVLVDNVGLQNATAAWDADSVVGSASTAASTSVAAIAAAVTTVATTVAAVTAVTTIATITTVATAVTLGLALALNLGHLQTISLNGVLFISVVDHITLGKSRAASIGPVVDDELLNEKTHLILLFFVESSELLSKLRSLELEANVGGEHHVAFVVGGSGTVSISLRNVDSLSTKKAESSK